MMTDFDELLTAAESEPPTVQTVQVCLNPAVARKRAVLLAELERAKQEDKRSQESDQRLSAPAPGSSEQTTAAVEALEEFDAEVAKSLVTIKFTRLPGDKWALLTSAFPMRVDVPLDRGYGYNFDAVSEKAARLSGVRVDDDGEHEITDDQWTRMLTILSGHDVEAIRDAVWSLNEYGPQQDVAALVKGFAGA